MAYRQCLLDLLGKHTKQNAVRTATICAAGLHRKKTRKRKRKSRMNLSKKKVKNTDTTRTQVDTSRDSQSVDAQTKRNFKQKKKKRKKENKTKRARTGRNSAPHRVWASLKRWPSPITDGINTSSFFIIHSETIQRRRRRHRYISNDTQAPDHAQLLWISLFIYSFCNYLFMSGQLMVGKCSYMFVCLFVVVVMLLLLICNCEFV